MNVSSFVLYHTLDMKYSRLAADVFLYPLLLYANFCLRYRDELLRDC